MNDNRRVIVIAESDTRALTCANPFRAYYFSRILFVKSSKMPALVVTDAVNFSANDTVRVPRKQLKRCPLCFCLMPSPAQVSERFKTVDRVFLYFSFDFESSSYRIMLPSLFCALYNINSCRGFVSFYSLCRESSIAELSRIVPS